MALVPEFLLAQTSDQASLDSLLLVSFPHDTLHFEGSALVEVNGDVGRLFWSNVGWAWNADTAAAHSWEMRLDSDAPLVSFDLNRSRGTQFPALPGLEGTRRWSPSSVEGVVLGRRFRMFVDGGDTLQVAQPDSLPESTVIADWHRHVVSASGLEALPRGIVPVAFQGTNGMRWRLLEVQRAPCSLVTSGILLFDPRRTLQDAVREHQRQR